MRRSLVVAVVALVIGMLFAAPPASAAPTTSGATCSLPESDAEALVILNTFYPNRYL
jgi:hypothetical protein